MLIAGAQQVLQGGRQDKDRLLVDRYRRDGELEIYHGQPHRANHMGSQEPGYRVASRNKDNNRAIRLINDNDQ